GALADTGALIACLDRPMYSPTRRWFIWRNESRCSTLHRAEGEICEDHCSECARRHRWSRPGDRRRSLSEQPPKSSGDASRVRQMEERALQLGTLGQGRSEGHTEPDHAREAETGGGTGERGV